MNESEEQLLFQHLAQQNTPRLHEEPLFDSFVDTDSILAAFIDGNLSEEQQQCVKRALAASFTLRQQWQQTLTALRSGKTSAHQESGVPTKKLAIMGPRLAIGALVASFAMVSFVLLQSKQVLTGADGTLQANAPVLLVPVETNAPTFASRSIARSDWEMFLAVYLNWTQEIGELGSPALELAHLAVAIEKMENSACEMTELTAVKFRFSGLLAEYPQELAPFEGKSREQWCRLGKTLQQYVEQSVLQNVN